MSLRLVVLLVAACGASFGTLYSRQASFINIPSGGSASGLSQKTITIPNGPTQGNSLFSTYPSWIQDFASESSGSLNSKYWEVYQGPAPSNDEAEYYTNNSANLRIEDGALILEATKQQEPQGYSYASARIDTMGKKTFLYGRIDVTAKLPDGVGTWPAVWFLPASNKYENLSPTSDSSRYLNGGEIDLVEQVGIAKDVEYGIVHTKSDLDNPGGVGTYNTVHVNNNTYNLYSLLWTPTSLTFEVNNVPFYTYTETAGANYLSWPFNQPFYLVMNLAMGGSWGGGDKAEYPPYGIDDSGLPASMNIQSIYYYPYTGPSS